MKSTKQAVYVGGKVVGHVSGDIFSKKVKGSKHFLRKPPAIAFDRNSLEQAERLGASKIIIHDTESRISYSGALQTVLKRGFKVNRGHGDQIALPLADWYKYEQVFPGGKAIGRIWNVTPPKNPAKQLEFL